MLLRRDLVQEQTRGFDHHGGADFCPLQVGRVTLLRQADLLAVDNQGIAFDGHFALETAMHTVVLQHVSQVMGFEQVVDANHFDVAEILQGRAQHVAADTAETVDANLDSHEKFLNFK